MKTNSRIGGQAANLFTSTTKTTIAKTPKVEKQQLVEKVVDKKVTKHQDLIKSTVTFSNNHLVWLDRLSADIRSNTRQVIDRGSIIRAMLNAIEESNIDLSCVTSAEEICNTILSNLKTKK